MSIGDFFNARRLLAFFTSKTGLAILFLVGLGILLSFVYYNTSKSQQAQQHQERSSEVRQMTGDQSAPPKNATVERPVADAQPVISEPPEPVRVAPVTTDRSPAPTARKAVEKKRAPLTLYTAMGVPTSTPAIKDDGTFKGGSNVQYAPYGRLLECRLVNTVESINTRTPIIAIVTKPLWWNHKVVIPAGTEVHGFGSPDALRDRIAGEGSWRLIVANDPSLSNGAEMEVKGVALDMEREEVEEDENGQIRINYGMTDGSAGLKGNVIKSDQWAEIKVFAATLISGAASGFTKTQTTLLGQVPVGGNLGNAGLGAAQAALDRYADQILKSIERDGFFVQVPAGKTFYLYVTQPLDSREAKLMGVPSKEQENQQAESNAAADPQELQRLLLQRLVDQKKAQAQAQAQMRETVNRQNNQAATENVDQILQQLQKLQQQQNGGGVQQ